MSILSRFTGRQVPSVDITTAHNRRPGTLLVDVREPSEWTAGHAPTAYHQPLGRLDARRLPRADSYYLICRSGHRSAKATHLLSDAGLDAYNVTGGMTAWAASGLPVVTEADS
jgi:rhodanese-related sulfurtransferase